MSLLNRYIAKTVWLSIFLVLIVIVGIDVLSAFIDESGSRKDAYGFTQIAQYVALTIPRRCYDYIPYAALIGAIIGLGQLASSSELVVIRSVGVSTARLAWVVLKQAIIIAALGFLLGEYVAPAAEQKAQSLRAFALYADRQSDAERGIWRRDAGLFMHVSGITAGNQIFGVTAYEFVESGWLKRVLTADRGLHQPGGWQLQDVAISNFFTDSVSTESRVSLFLESAITPKIFTLENVAPSQLSPSDLIDYTAFLRSQGEDARKFELALWLKFTQPLAVAALVLVAISFVFGPLRDGTLGFRIFAGVMIGVFFRLSQEMLGPASLVLGFAPVYAALAPIAVSLIVGAYLLLQKS